MLPSSISGTLLRQISGLLTELLRQIGGLLNNIGSQKGGLLNISGGRGQSIGVGGDVAGVLDGLLGGLLVTVECLLAVLPCNISLVLSGLTDRDGDGSVLSNKGLSVNGLSRESSGEDGSSISSRCVTSGGTTITRESSWGNSSIRSRGSISSESSRVSTGEGTIGGECSKSGLALEVGGILLLSRELRSLLSVLILRILSHLKD